jgi:hypothetical protein
MTKIYSTRGIESTTAPTLYFESLTWRYWNHNNKTWNDDDTLQVRASVIQEAPKYLEVTSSGGAAEKQSSKIGIYEKGEGLVWKHSSSRGKGEKQIYEFNGLWHIGNIDMGGIESTTAPTLNYMTKIYSTRGIESTTAPTLDFESLTWRYWNHNNKTWNDDYALQVRALVCAVGEFQCGNGKCIKKSWKCDGKNDCHDGSVGSDEKDCVCAESEFQCDDGDCIDNNLQCDNYPDCFDESDETLCGIA